jgi:hypothetical protein
VDLEAARRRLGAGAAGRAAWLGAGRSSRGCSGARVEPSGCAQELLDVRLGAFTRLERGQVVAQGGGRVLGGLGQGSQLDLHLLRQHASRPGGLHHRDQRAGAAAPEDQLHRPVLKVNRGLALACVQAGHGIDQLLQRGEERPLGLPRGQIDAVHLERDRVHELAHHLFTGSRSHGAPQREAHFWVGLPTSTDANLDHVMRGSSG